MFTNTIDDRAKRLTNRRSPMQGVCTRERGGGRLLEEDLFSGTYGTCSNRDWHSVSNLVCTLVHNISTYDAALCYHGGVQTLKFPQIIYSHSHEEPFVLLDHQELSFSA